MFDELLTDHPTPQFGPQIATILQKMSGLHRSPAAVPGDRSPAAAPDFPVQALHQALVEQSPQGMAMIQAVQLSILDDGQGFDVAQTLDQAHTQGMGLLGMQERIESLGGQLEIDSSPHEGAHLVATIPLTASVALLEVI